MSTVRMRAKRARGDVKSGVGWGELFKLIEKAARFQIDDKIHQREENWRPEREMVSGWGWGWVGGIRRKGSGPDHKPIS